MAHRTIAHVLFIDDDPALVRLGTLRLTRLGFEVTGCESAEEALELFRDHPVDFDVVVTDLSMPGMSGMELARQLLGLRPELPILLVSGQFRPEDSAEALRIGIRHTIPKSEALEQIPACLSALFRPTAP
jgi:CheY-like chemotaxis protein